MLPWKQPAAEFMAVGAFVSAPPPKKDELSYELFFSVIKRAWLDWKFFPSYKRARWYKKCKQVHRYIRCAKISSAALKGLLLNKFQVSKYFYFFKFSTHWNF